MLEKFAWTPQQIALVRRMRAAGFNNEEIRQALGGLVSKKRLWQLIHEEAMPPRPRQGGHRTPNIRRHRLKGPTLPVLPSLMEP